MKEWNDINEALKRIGELNYSCEVKEKQSRNLLSQFRETMLSEIETARQVAMARFRDDYETYAKEISEKNNTSKDNSDAEALKQSIEEFVKQSKEVEVKRENLARDDYYIEFEKTLLYGKVQYRQTRVCGAMLYPVVRDGVTITVFNDAVKAELN